MTQGKFVIWLPFVLPQYGLIDDENDVLIGRLMITVLIDPPDIDNENTSCSLVIQS